MAAEAEAKFMQDLELEREENERQAQAAEQARLAEAQRQADARAHAEQEAVRVQAQRQEQARVEAAQQAERQRAEAERQRTQVAAQQSQAQATQGARPAQIAGPCQGDSLYIGQAQRTLYMIRTNSAEGVDFSGYWKEPGSHYAMTLNPDGTGIFNLDAPDLKLNVIWYLMGECDGTVKSLAPNPPTRAYMLMMKVSTPSSDPMLRGNYPPGELISKVIHNAQGHFQADGMVRR